MPFTQQPDFIQANQDVRVAFGLGWVEIVKALAIARQLLDRSLTDHSVVTMQFHTDPNAQPEPHYTQAVRWLEGSLEYARSKGIPIWVSSAWLQCWEAQHGATMQDFDWNAAERRLAFDVDVNHDPGVPLALMIPMTQDGAILSQVTVDDSVVSIGSRGLRGDQDGWITVPFGRHHIEALYWQVGSGGRAFRLEQTPGLLVSLSNIRFCPA